ncbi:MAG TPA: ribonuclease P Rpr2/Rpp21/SNM1 subunit [Candidatus Poseidoniales archaeon]|nr:ribonuclease P Rpr2/Rpp21/SNM1 subunit [Candidatus Poseidoniales archaeon]
MSRRRTSHRVVGRQGMDHLEQILFNKDAPLGLRDKAADQILILAKRLKVALSPAARRHICRSCRTALIAGVTCSMRWSRGMLRIRCNRCGIARHRRF